jgi:type VI secretion system protein VasG
LEEPSVETSILILRGVKESYEKSHGVLIRDEAVVAAADYSSRFIMGRYLPDKAFDLMDTACARVKVSLASKPAILEDTEKRLEARSRELNALIRDARDAETAPDEEHLALLKEENGRDQKEVERLQELFKSQKEKALAAIKARTLLREAEKKQEEEAKAEEAKAEEAKAAPTEEIEKGQDAFRAKEAETPSAAESSPREESSAEENASPLEKSSPEAQADRGAASQENDISSMSREYHKAKVAFDESLKGEPLLSLEVSADTVAKVVSDWTGIPLGKIASDKAKLISQLEQKLKERIKGQNEAIENISAVIKGAQAGLKDPVKPTGVFLLVGPSGVGKTETGLALADLLFGDENNVISINMSEFQEKYTVSRLIGSAPGYVGYGEGGLLTEAVSQRPYSVVLLDEVEKAHLDVLNLFYQVFDKGELSDAEGKKVNFRETVIFLTSNLGSELIINAREHKPELSYDEIIELIRPELSHFFKPALLARMTVVAYRSLGKEALRSITDIKLGQLKTRLKTNNNMDLFLEDGITESILERATDVESGARNIDAIISSNLIRGLSREILTRMSTSEKLPAKVTIGISEKGEFSYNFGD